MKKVKKYYPGVNGLTYDNSKSVGVLASKQEDPNAFSTGKFLFPQQKTLGNIVDNKVMSQDYLNKAKPSFMDKAGNFMNKTSDFIGNYGGAITQAAGSLLPLLMKKPDPNAKPYKTGTNMIKYQNNKPNNKTNKSKFIKYQEGNEYLQSGKGMSNVLNAMEENNNNLSNASIKPEEFDMASLNDYMPDIPKRQSPQPIEVGPSRKEIARLMREYNKKEFQAGRFGNMDKSDPRYKQLATRNEANAAREEYEKLYSQNENDYKKLKNNYKELEPLSTKTPLLNLKLAKTAELPSNLKSIPVEKKSRRERKAENRKLEAMAKAPITYNEDSFVGPPQFVGPSDQELQLGKTREDAQSARNTYEARLAGESARSAYEAKQKNTSTNSNKYIDFKDMTPAQQKQYRAGIKSGNKFTVDGIGDYGAATKSQQTQSAKMSSKGGNKPLVKMKGENSWTEADWQKLLKERKPTLGKNFNNSNFKQSSEQRSIAENSFDPYSGAGFKIPFSQGAQTSAQQKPAQQKGNTQKPAQKGMSNDFFERLTGVTKNLNQGAVKQNQKEILNKFGKSGQLKGIKESLTREKNIAAGRYKAPEAPRADLGKKGVKTYWERVTSKQMERDPRAEYAYQKLAPWGKVKSEGPIDYLSTLFSSPQKTTNYMLTGRYETPLDTYNLAKSKDDRIKGIPKVVGDIATDPMMYPEAIYGAGKIAAKGAVKAGKAIGGLLQKIPYGKIGKAIEKVGGRILSEKGRISQAALHFNEDSKEREEREKGRPTFSMK